MVSTGRISTLDIYWNVQYNIRVLRLRAEDRHYSASESI